MNLLYKIIQTAAAMWLGMQLTAGYVTAPILFRLLPKMQAGEIAGILFAITALLWLSYFWRSLCLFQTAAGFTFLVDLGTLATLSLQPSFGYAGYRGTQVRAG